jgi:hypothetical protein
MAKKEVKKHMNNHINNMPQISLMLSEVLSISPHNLIELIFLKYIEFGNIQSVMKYLNLIGYRVKNERGYRKYNQYDISGILKDEPNYWKVNERIIYIYTEIKKLNNPFRSRQKKFSMLCDGYFKARDRPEKVKH